MPEREFTHTSMSPEQREAAEVEEEDEVAEGGGNAVAGSPAPTPMASTGWISMPFGARPSCPWRKSKKAGPTTVIG
ncbi:MAG: hypothetical protein EPN48_18285 [Microbacteriaceae bacterium]|nr:MAG: hypothetical protein EPN48_18285 [Microbacteriaceae bacterium]